MTQQILFSICALLSVAVLLVHSIFGGLRIVAPTNQSELPDLTKAILEYGWHSISVLFLSLAAFYALSAMDSQYNIFALIATYFFAANCLLGLLMMIRKPILRKAPGPIFSGVITIIAVIGLYQ